MTLRVKPHQRVRVKRKRDHPRRNPKRRQRPEIWGGRKREAGDSWSVMPIFSTNFWEGSFVTSSGSFSS